MQLAERIVQVEHFDRDVVDGDSVEVQVVPAVVPTVLLGPSAARTLDQDAPHRLRCGREEVAAAVEAGRVLAPAEQAQVGLVDQGGGLDRLARSLAGHAGAREVAELLVDQREKPLRAGGIALLDRRKDLCHLLIHRPHHNPKKAGLRGVRCGRSTHEEVMTNNGRDDQAEKIFHDARALPAEHRPAFLQGACGADADLRLLVEELLSAEERAEAGGFLTESKVQNQTVLQRIEARGPRISPVLLNERADSEAPLLRVGSPGAHGHRIIDQYHTTRKRSALARAADAELGPALERLDTCGADAELVALARHCMQPERSDRPKDAKVVSDRIAAHLAGVDERARSAAIQVATSRRTQKLLVAIAVVVCAGLAASLAFWWQAEEQRQVADKNYTDVQKRNVELEDIAYASGLREVAESLEEGRMSGVARTLEEDLDPKAERRGLAWRWLRARVEAAEPMELVLHEPEGALPTSWRWLRALEDVRLRESLGEIAAPTWLCWDVDRAATRSLLVWKEGNLSRLRITSLRDGKTLLDESGAAKFAVFVGAGRFVVVDHDGSLALRDGGGAVLATGSFGGPVGPKLYTGGLNKGVSPSASGAVAVSPDGQRLALGGVDGSVKIFRVADLAPLDALAEWESRPVAVSCVEFGPDGQRLLVGNEEGTARLVDAASGALLQQLEHVGDHVLAAAFQPPDGKRLLLTGGGGAVSVWDLERQRLLHELEPHRQPESNLWYGYSAEFSPDGRLALTAGEDTRLRIYSTEQWNRVAILPRGAVARFDEDGTAIVATEGGRVLRWELEDLPLPFDLPHRGIVEDVLCTDGERAFAVGGGSGGKVEPPRRLDGVLAGRHGPWPSIARGQCRRDVAGCGAARPAHRHPRCGDRGGAARARDAGRPRGRAGAGSGLRPPGLPGAQLPSGSG